MFLKNIHKESWCNGSKLTPFRVVRLMCIVEEGFGSPNSSSEKDDIFGVEKLQSKMQQFIKIERLPRSIKCQLSQ
ncbi:hypothetical protein ACHQM5_023990 [Ranunculus cassubicifolius]